MEKFSGEASSHQDSVSHSFSYDTLSYERFHDEVMDAISVSVHYSDCEEDFKGNLSTNLTSSGNLEKKMKISLSQEQMRKGSKNLLSIPANIKKARSSNFIQKLIPPVSIVDVDVHEKSSPTAQLIQANDAVKDEIIYAVPRKASPLSTPTLTVQVNEINTSSDSPSSSKNVATKQAELNRNFKYPLSFYCKICNNILSDPRTLDCLHSFCFQCLLRLEASNNLQNNQFSRKISENSESSCEFLTLIKTMMINEFFILVLPSLLVPSSIESEKFSTAKQLFTGGAKTFFKDKARLMLNFNIDIVNFIFYVLTLNSPQQEASEEDIHPLFPSPRSQKQ